MLAMRSGMHANPQAAVTGQRARQLREEDVPVMVTVKAAKKAGLIVRYEHLEGFVPISHPDKVGASAWASPTEGAMRTGRSLAASAARLQQL